MSLLMWQEKKKQNQTNHKLKKISLSKGASKLKARLCPQAVTVSLGNKHILLAFIFSIAELQHVKGALSFKT